MWECCQLNIKARCVVAYALMYAAVSGTQQRASHGQATFCLALITNFLFLPSSNLGQEN